MIDSENMSANNLIAPKKNTNQENAEALGTNEPPAKAIDNQN